MNPPSQIHPLIALVMFVLACAPVSAQGEVKVWTTPAMTRVMLTEKAPASASHEITIQACRNEWESAQVVISGSAELLSQLNYQLEILNSENAETLPIANLYQQLDVQIKKNSPRAPLAAGWYPDALVPFESGFQPTLGSFRKHKGMVNLRLWIDFYLPKGLKAGNYAAKLRVTEPSTKALLGEATITVVVLSGTLPDKPTLKSYFGLEEHRIARIHGLDRNKNGVKLAQVMERYYQLLADSRLQPGLVFASSPPLSENNDLIWSEPASETLPAPEQVVNDLFGSSGRFNCLHLPMWLDYPFADPLGSDRKEAISYLAKLAKLARQTAPGASLFFTVGRLDEPDTAMAYQQIRKWASLVHEASAMAKTSIKFFVTEQPQAQDATWGSLIGAVDIWAPHVMWAWEDLESKKGKRIIQERIKAGDEVWCYPALAQFRDQWKQEKGLPNMATDAYPPVWLTDYPAINYRILPWICAAHGMTGIHYWNAFEWPESIDPWDDAGSFVIEDEVFNGDGLLIYPPAPARLVGKKHASTMQPCASIRLKWLRDGMDDYEHLQLLRKKNPATSRNIRTQVARGFSDWQTSPAKIDAVRTMISNTLRE